MKKIYFTTILMVFVTAGFSQTQKNSWLLGGNLDFTATSQTANGQGGNSTVFALNPLVGYFPANNFAVILNTNYISESYKTDGSPNSFSDHSLNIGPLVRYYFPASESVKFYVGGGVSFGSMSGEHSTTWQLQAGPAFFITHAVALEFNINYQSTHFTSDGFDYATIQSQFGMGVGFMIYLGKK